MTNPVNHNNFELLYIYISKIDRCYENVSFKFTNKYEILYNKEFRELTIKQNQNDYLENFFGDKISSINLIVGENGSGKTTLLDLIGLTRENRSDYFKKMDYDENGGWFALYKIEENQFYIEGENHNLIKNIDLPNNEKINWIYSLYFEYNYTDNYIDGKLSGSHIHRDIPYIFYKKKKLEHRFIKKDNSRLDSEDYSHLLIREYISNNKYSDLYELATKNPSFISVFNNIPLNINLNFLEINKYNEKSRLEELITSLLLKEVSRNLTTKEKIIIRIYLNEIKDIYYTYIYTEETEIHDNLSLNDIIKINYLNKYLCDIKKLCDESDNIVDTIKNICEITCDSLNIKDKSYYNPHPETGSLFFNELQTFIELVNNIPIEYFKHYLSTAGDWFSQHLKIVPLPVETFKISIPFNHYCDEIYELLDYYSDDNRMFSNDIKIFNKLESDNNISEGELNYITSFCGLFNAMNNVWENQKSCIIILDEPDQGFHPKWITSYIDTIVKIAEKFDNNCKYQIIISTHSPFMVSDVPKEWINCIKVENNKRSVINPQQSFACNYYDIIKDNFFLENSMGEFAFSKIRKFYDVLKPEIKEKNSKTSICYKTKEDICKQLNINDISSIENVVTSFIDSIGEVLIKIQLKDLWENTKKEWNKNKVIPNNDTEKQKELYNIFNKLDKQQQDEIIKKIKDEYHAKN